MTRHEAKIREQTVTIWEAYRSIMPLASLSASDFLLMRREAIQELGMTAYAQIHASQKPDDFKPLNGITSEITATRSSPEVSRQIAKRDPDEETKPVEREDTGDEKPQPEDGFALLQRLSDPWN